VARAEKAQGLAGERDGEPGLPATGADALVVAAIGFAIGECDILSLFTQGSDRRLSPQAQSLLAEAEPMAGGTGRGGSPASEPRPSERRKSAVVARNDGRPRLPKRRSSSNNFRASSVSITPLLSVARILLISARVIGCS